MSTKLTNNAPYYDDYDANKKYMQILALPGRVAQSREFTQSQSILLDLIKRLGDTILRDGSIVDGMGFTINEEKTKITIEPGSVYIGGIVHYFDGDSIDITGIGEENVGVKVVETIVTEANDKSLRDPAQGYANYAQPGAHRLKAEVILTLNDPASPALYSFIDGTLKIDPVKPQLDAVLDLLANRTYDEIGNYKVHGLNLWAEDRDEDTIALIVEDGKAYVRGYEVSKPVSSRIVVNKVKDTRAVYNEPKTYKSTMNKYYFNNNPVHSILKTVGTVEVTENITRGNVSGGIDVLPKTPVVEIVSVSQSGTTFSEGEDFQLSADGIDWSLAGQEPKVGTTYQATYRYNKILEQDIDYTLEVEGEGENKRYFLQFTENGDKPVEGTQIVSDYKFLLARIDLVTLNQFGDIIVIPGQPDILSRARAPIHANPNTLQLGILIQPPNSDEPQARTDSISKLNMEDLQDIVERVKDIEYNQALTALDQETLNAEAGTALKGIFSDGFGSTTRGDLGHPDFSVAYNLNEKSIQLPIKEMISTQPDINQDSSKVKIWGRVVTAPYTEKMSINQPYATSDMLVNPYKVFTQMGVLKLTPEVDNWIDEEIIVEGQKTNNKSISVPTLSSGRRRFTEVDFKRSGGWNRYTGEKQDITSRTIMEEAITFMRQREVEIKAENLLENSDNLELIFDGKKVNLIPTGTTKPGTELGTVCSDSKGKVTAKFTIPPGVRTGTREVTLRNHNNIATSSFTAHGQKRVTGQTVLTTKITLNVYDPLAQSFSFIKSKILSSVGLYFSKGDPEHNVLIQIRNMANGFPGQEIYAEKVLTPTDIKLSDDSSIETKVTFDTPVMCNAGQQYCITILTDSDKYSMFIGELGKKELTSQKTITSQPYTEGVLFSSSNAITWTPHQTKDLKFKVYTAKFNREGIIEFNPITNLSADKILLLADQLTPENTGCEWEFRVEPNGQYRPISSYEDLDLEKVIEFIQLKAKFDSNENMSPIMAIDSFNLLSFMTEKTGSYISKNTEFSQAYTEVKQVFEAKIPSGCTVKPQFSYDGVTWIDGIFDDSKQITNEFTQFTYITPVETEKNATNFRARINITSPNSILRPQVRKFMNIVR